MSDNEINAHFVLNLRDDELSGHYREMDSVQNLNQNPMAIRVAGLKAARRAFLLGVRYAESNQQNKGNQ